MRKNFNYFTQYKCLFIIYISYINLISFFDNFLDVLPLFVCLFALFSHSMSQQKINKTVN